MSGWLGPAIGAVGGIVDAFTQPGRDKDARLHQAEMYNRQKKENRHVLQNQLQWRMDDAQRAGIHPLAAMGMNPASGPSMSVGDAGGSSGNWGNVGQDISRAISAAAPKDQRNDKLLDLQLEAAKADLTHKHITNAALASQLQKQQQVGPPAPDEVSGYLLPGQGNSPRVRVNPRNRDASEPGYPHITAGATPDADYAITSKGYMPVIPKDLAESLESDTLGSIDWFIRNRVLPLFTGGDPGKKLPKGKDSWHYSWPYGYVPSNKPGKHKYPNHRGMRH